MFRFRTIQISESGAEDGQAAADSYFEWRQDIAVAQLAGDWTRVQELLEDKAENPVCNAALQRQFYLMMQGHVRKRLSRDFAESAALYEQAFRITIPDFPCQMSDSILLNVQEIMLLLFWQAVQPDKRYSGELLKFLEQYVPAHFRDEQVTIKIYPKIVSAYLPFLLEQGKYTECFSMAEKTIDMMVSSAYASCMQTVLHFYIQAAEKIGREQGLPEKRVQLAAWKELMDAFGQSGDDNAENELLPDVWQEIELLRHYQESRVRLEFHYRTAMLIVVHLSQCTGVMKNYVKELKYSEEGIRLHMISGARKLLPTCVNNLADALENMGQKEKALKFYRLAFYSAELMKREGTAKVARRSYEKLLGREIQWY